MPAVDAGATAVTGKGGAAAAFPLRPLEKNPPDFFWGTALAAAAACTSKGTAAAGAVTPGGGGAASHAPGACAEDCGLKATSSTVLLGWLNGLLE